MKSVRNVGVIGWWHYDNQGDLTILENMTRALSPHRVVPIDLPFEINEDELERLNHFDFLLLGGGGLFQSAPPPPFDTFDVWGPRLRTPIGVVGLGIDEIPSKHRTAVLTLVEQARFFYVRDQASQCLVGHPKVRVAPDLSFLYPLPLPLQKPCREASSLQEIVCGINLRNVPSFAMWHWIEVLQRLPVCFRGIPLSSFGTWRELETLRHLDPQCYPTFDAALYQGLDMMIGMAFHSIVFAIQSAVPVIGIAYAPKVRRLLVELGLDDYLLEMDEQDHLLALVERVFTERSLLAERLGQVAADLSRAAQQTFADVKREVEGVARAPSQPGPRVSIIVLGSASDKANRTTITSCLHQTYDNIEVVFAADDCQLTSISRSDTADRLRLVTSKPQASLGYRLNQALTHVTGKYLTWTVAGNYYAHDAIACMVAYLQREPRCDMVFTDYYSVHGADLIANVHCVDSAHKLFRRNVIGPCFLYRRTLSDGVGLFNESTDMPAYDYWLRAHPRYNLQPMHARLFFELTANHEMANRQQMERESRRMWRLGQPWPLQALWRILDTDFVENVLFRPLLIIRRKFKVILDRLRNLQREGEVK